MALVGKYILSERAGKEIHLWEETILQFQQEVECYENIYGVPGILQEVV